MAYNGLSNKMKIKIYSLFSFILASIMLCACGSDDNNEVENQPEIKEYSEVGVWTSGKYFISIDGSFLCAYFAPNMLDCGTYSKVDKTLLTQNSYFAKTTKYTIKSIDETTLSVNIDYVDLLGKEQTVSLKFNKSEKPCSAKENPLIGKSYSYLTANVGTVTLDFETYNTAKKKSSKSPMSKYPLSLFYIYNDGIVYYQSFVPSGIQVPTIGGWTSGQTGGPIRAIQLKMSSSGSIVDHKDVTDEMV